MGKLFFLFLVFSINLFARGKDIHINTDSPWFTGPLLTFSGNVIPAGYYNIEPYIFYTTIGGIYDEEWKSVSKPNFYSALLEIPLYVGLTEKSNLFFAPSVVWNKTQGVSTLNFADLTVGISFQLLKENSTPGIKISIHEVFPTGKFDNLRADKFGTDVGGTGSFQTLLGIAIGRTFRIYDDHFLATRFNIFVDFPSPVKVEGINAYGGVEDTQGKVHLGTTYISQLGLEYNLTKNWALACDVQAFYSDKRKFVNTRKTPCKPKQHHLDLAAIAQFSLAPAIEYNFNDSVGIIGGTWFTVAGKNSPRFFSAVIAINYYGPLPQSR